MMQHTPRSRLMTSRMVSFWGQGINAPKQDTEKADCTDGSQPGK